MGKVPRMFRLTGISWYVVMFWNFSSCSPTIEYRRNFFLEIYSWFFSEPRFTEMIWEFWCDRSALGLLQCENGAGELIQRDCSTFLQHNSWCAACFLPHSEYWGSPLRLSCYLRKLWNKKVFQWILSFSGCKLPARRSPQICVVLFFAYINQMISVNSAWFVTCYK